MPNYNVGDLVGVTTSFDNGCDGDFSIPKNQEIRISKVYEGDEKYRIVALKAFNNNDLSVEELFDTLLYSYELDDHSSLVSEFTPKFSKGDNVRMTESVRGLDDDAVYAVDSVDTSDLSSFYEVGGYWLSVDELEDHAELDASSVSNDAERVEVKDDAIIRFVRDFTQDSHTAVACAFMKVTYVYSSCDADVEGAFLENGELKSTSIRISADDLNTETVELLASDPTKVEKHIQQQMASMRVLLAALKSLLS